MLSLDEDTDLRSDIYDTTIINMDDEETGTGPMADEEEEEAEDDEMIVLDPEHVCFILYLCQKLLTALSRPLTLGNLLRSSDCSTF